MDRPVTSESSVPKAAPETAAVTVVECLIAEGGTFVSRPVDALTLDFTRAVKVRRPPPAR